MAFAQRVLNVLHVEQRRCLEVGSYNVNGSLRSVVEALWPSSYIGTDMRPGPGVDEVIGAELVAQHYGRETVDLVLCAEMLEHAENWRGAIQAMKDVLSPGGHILLTTRSHGYRLHDFPDDHWRFETEDLAAIFADFDVLSLERDPQVPGAFIFARKPDERREAVHLDRIEVWSMKSAARGPHPGQRR